MSHQPDGGPWPSERPAPPALANAADERQSLEEFLGYYRAALVDRAWGLTHDQLQVQLAPSDLSLGKLLAHMAFVERIWFQVRFAGEEMPEPWSSLDWEADPDAEMTAASTMTIEQLLAQFNGSVDYSKAKLSVVEDLGQLSERTDREGHAWNMRWILIHMIEEYARHCGHADLIRQSIDGDTAD